MLIHYPFQSLEQHTKIDYFYLTSEAQRGQVTCLKLTALEMAKNGIKMLASDSYLLV